MEKTADGKTLCRARTFSAPASPPTNCRLEAFEPHKLIVWFMNYEYSLNDWLSLNQKQKKKSKMLVTYKISFFSGVEK